MATECFFFLFLMFIMYKKIGWCVFSHLKLRDNFFLAVKKHAIELMWNEKCASALISNL